jgi:flagella basal body P-ring formation protein FlgA
VTVELRDIVTLENRMVKLSDIASIKADDKGLVERFGGTQLLMLGQRGQPLRLTRERVRHALDKRLPGLRDAYRLVGTQAVQLTWSGPALDGAALQAWAVSTLGKLLRSRMPVAEISITPYPMPASGPLYVPPGRIAYEVKHVQPELATRMTMLVDVLVDDRVAFSVPVWMKVQGIQQAWRVRHDTQAGAVLDLAMLERVDAPLSDQPVVSNELPATGGVRLKHAKPAGSLLMADDVDPKKPVERGSEIVVRVVRGGIAVEDRALALNEAVQGGRVRVVNPRTQASYLATVVSDGVAEVR